MEDYYNSIPKELLNKDGYVLAMDKDVYEQEKHNIVDGMYKNLKVKVFRLMSKGNMCYGQIFMEKDFKYN